MRQYPDLYRLMFVLVLLFWLLLFGVFFTYVGYALLLLAFGAGRRSRNAPPVQWPSLTVVIAAWNEGPLLAAKIRNTLEQRYPGALQVLVVADGSTDQTAEVLSAFPSVELLIDPQRRGKTGALNRAMRHVSTPLVIFSDANTLLGPAALFHLVLPFGDARVGAVAGEKRVRQESGMGFAEGGYWHYESYLKRLDAGFYSAIGAAGELFALRTTLFRPLPEDTILDDLALSLSVGLQDYRIAYEPAAYALEAPSASLHDERKRKVRIAAGAFQFLERLDWAALLRRPRLAFQFIVRRWMRWVFCPLALPLLLLLNGILAFAGAGPLYAILLVLQLCAYFLALTGALLLRSGRAFFPVTFPFYFLFMNYCMLAGWRRHRKGQQSVLWEKAR